jgi:tetratricopeptide (TPR) repeat protein
VLRRLHALMLTLVLLVGTRAVAQPSARAQAEARELYKKAMTHYELGEFEVAITEFKRAYELTSAPGLLFNIAQVYRMKKDPEQAIYFYRTYLRLMPDAPNRADVESLMAENQVLLDEKRAKEKAAALSPPDRPAPTPMPIPAATTSAAPAPVPHHWRAKLWTGVGVAAVGLGALGAGVAMGVRSANDGSDLQRASMQGGNAWDASRQRLYRDGQNAAVAADVLYAGGAVLVATGAVLAFLGGRERAADRRVALVPLRGGASLVVSCDF